VVRASASILNRVIRNSAASPFSTISSRIVVMAIIAPTESSTSLADQRVKNDLDQSTIFLRMDAINGISLPAKHCIRGIARRSISKEIYDEDFPDCNSGASFDVDCLRLPDELQDADPKSP
jgi:hypothetical protein